MQMQNEWYILQKMYLKVFKKKFLFILMILWTNAERHVRPGEM